MAQDFSEALTQAPVADGNMYTFGGVEVSLEQLRKHYIGTIRGIRRESEGANQIIPAFMMNPYFTPEGITKQVCVDIDLVTGQPIWKDTVDEPAPPGAYMQSDQNISSHTDMPAAFTPPYDYRPPAHASDTQSGGPANFDGNGGGNNNPRNPVLEGETADQYKKEVAEYREQMLALQSQVSDIAAMVSGLSTLNTTPVAEVPTPAAPKKKSKIGGKKPKAPTVNLDDLTENGNSDK